MRRVPEAEFKERKALGSEWRLKRLKKLAERDGLICCYCKCRVFIETGPLSSPNSATLEHLQPRSLGGTSELENLAIACTVCNAKRGNGNHKRPKITRRVVKNYSYLLAKTLK